ncbi:MAG: DUF6273 domain-containing protein [Eubacteriaceae bacterium]|nr:DUF6273 domain-containing protein [Eubacteriaceae bacterium]
MSLPVFPRIPANQMESQMTVTIGQILQSVAMEELALSHILNAEGEKIQLAIGTLTNSRFNDDPILATDRDLANILGINESVKNMLGAVSQNQMFLLGKMASAMNSYGTFVARLQRRRITYLKGAVSAVNGRIAGAELTGDDSAWLEVGAYPVLKSNEYSGYSLIVRNEPINLVDVFGYVEGSDPLPEFQTAFGPDNEYANSNPRKLVNNWFDGNGTGQTLAQDAKLRNFTVKNSAFIKTGKGPIEDLKAISGMSMPSKSLSPTGDDVAFILSFQEAARFASKQSNWETGLKSSELEAQSNFKMLTSQPNAPGAMGNWSNAWLRTPGDSDLSASCLNFSGMVSKQQIYNLGVVHPALWVKSSLFNTNN